MGTLRRVLISNLACYNAPKLQGSILSGIPGSQIEDVKLSNIYIQTAGGGTTEDAKAQVAEMENGYPDPWRFGPIPASGFFLRHMRNVEFSHVEVANSVADGRPAFHLHDVDRADFFAITAARGSAGAFALHDVKDFRVGWSRAAADVALSSVDQKSL